jgi:hypothetical protein
METWCPGWESNPHEEKSPEDFKFFAPLFLVLSGQAFTVAYLFREWPSLPLLPRPSLANGHKSAIVLGPEIYLGILGSAPLFELRSSQFVSGKPECTVLPRAYFLIEVAAGSVAPESVSGASS